VRADGREEFVAPVKPSDREDFDTFTQAYHALLTHPDDAVSLDAAKRWSRWESQVARLVPNTEAIAKSDTDIRWARTFALMECHYSLNCVSLRCVWHVNRPDVQGFLRDGQLIEEEQIAKMWALFDLPRHWANR